MFSIIDLTCTEFETISMRRILSERNLVVILFLVALVIFVLAQEDTRKIEKMYMSGSSSVTSIAPAPSPSADLQTPADRIMN